MQENEKQEQHETEPQDLDFPAEFDSLINANGKITPALLTVVNRYFLYFSFFESLLLGCSGSQGNSSKYAAKLLEFKLVDLDVLKRTYFFFADRYLADVVKFENLCGDLEHTSQKARDEKIKAMQLKTNDPEIQLGVCIFVCFRLRNNLFHGPKWRYLLDGQEDLLLIAGNFIHSILLQVPSRDGWEFKNILTSTD
ncbi:hypothetical protein HCW80_14140 [Escherichia coli]|uniref:hypothetical protein n=1 Tax=Escherichia coli TaxID=562 RepID=UPI0004948543|nr:hypothetical protein [Escherichia coli]EEU9387422.1 hypothetical protein [Escherichia coli]EEW1879554.1 hypothetical protein [Escherichia coli]EFB7448804.1 hypothetical protein [Escherichia coli]EFB8790656.1 hypothetical protein [Escherichia coli]EFH4124172.1 hypothetical protein [Escherichia coli]